MSKTGAYVRIMRDGKWQNLDITELNDNELRNFFQGQSETQVLNWAMILAGWIRDNVIEELNHEEMQTL